MKDLPFILAVALCMVCIGCLPPGIWPEIESGGDGSHGEAETPAPPGVEPVTPVTPEWEFHRLELPDDWNTV